MIIEKIINAIDDINQAIEFKNLETKTIKWARDRHLFELSTPKDQALKTVSEVGEFCDNAAKGNCVKDDIGDILVTLIIQCEMRGYSLLDCLRLAYNTIAKRKGKTVNGVFIKEE